MSKSGKSTLVVHGTSVCVLSQDQQDFICLTDIARFKNPDRIDDLIRNWLRNRNTVEFLGVWERLHNPGFNPVEFDGIKAQRRGQVDESDTSISRLPSSVFRATV